MRLVFLDIILCVSVYVLEIQDIQARSYYIVTYVTKTAAMNSNRSLPSIVARRVFYSVIYDVLCKKVKRKKPDQHARSGRSTKVLQLKMFISPHLPLLHTKLADKVVKTVNVNSAECLRSGSRFRSTVVFAIVEIPYCYV